MNFLAKSEKVEGVDKEIAEKVREIGKQQAQLANHRHNFSLGTEYQKKYEQAENQIARLTQEILDLKKKRNRIDREKRIKDAPAITEKVDGLTEIVKKKAHLRQEIKALSAQWSVQARLVEDLRTASSGIITESNAGSFIQNKKSYDSETLRLIETHDKIIALKEELGVVDTELKVAGNEIRKQYFTEARPHAQKGLEHLEKAQEYFQEINKLAYAATVGLVTHGQPIYNPGSGASSTLKGVIENIKRLAEGGR